MKENLSLLVSLFKKRKASSGGRLWPQSPTLTVFVFKRWHLISLIWFVDIDFIDINVIVSHWGGALNTLGLFLKSVAYCVSIIRLENLRIPLQSPSYM